MGCRWPSQDSPSSVDISTLYVYTHQVALLQAKSSEFQKRAYRDGVKRGKQERGRERNRHTNAHASIPTRQHAHRPCTQLNSSQLRYTNL